MYKHVSHYKLNKRSKCQNPTVKAKYTALLTYSLSVRFKYQTRRLCRGLFYSLQVNAPQNKRSWNTPERILQNLAKFKEHTHLAISSDAQYCLQLTQRS